MLGSKSRRSCNYSVMMMGLPQLYYLRMQSIGSGSLNGLVDSPTMRRMAGRETKGNCGKKNREKLIYVHCSWLRRRDGIMKMIRMREFIMKGFSRKVIN